VARPRPERAQRDRLLVAPPRRVRQALSRGWTRQVGGVDGTMPAEPDGVSLRRRRRLCRPSHTHRNSSAVVLSFRQYR
jgi:hypothetical protein